MTHPYTPEEDNHETHSNQANLEPSEMDQSPQSDTDLLSEMLYLYVGPNANKFSSLFGSTHESEPQTRGAFNWPAFVLTLPWFLYRKLYISGLVISIILPIIIASVFNELFVIVHLGLQILVGMYANRYYVRSANSKLEDKSQRQGKMNL